MCTVEIRDKDKGEWTAKHLAAANITYLCVISGFCHEVDEICALLGYYTPYCGNYLLTDCPLVRNYHTMQHNIPEECKSHYLLNNKPGRCIKGVEVNICWNMDTLQVKIFGYEEKTAESDYN
jgi:hypothetical protein